MQAAQYRSNVFDVSAPVDNETACHADHTNHSALDVDVSWSPQIEASAHAWNSRWFTGTSTRGIAQRLLAECLASPEAHVQWRKNLLRIL